MIKKLNVIKPVQDGRTVVFYSPIEGEDILVRTGVPQIDSFFHSVLRSTFKQYPQLSEEKKEKVVTNFKRKLSRMAVNTEVYNEIYKSNVKYSLENIYYFCSSPSKSKGKITGEILKLTMKNEKELEYYKILLQLIDINTLGEIIVDNKETSYGEKCLSYFRSLEDISGLPADKLQIFEAFLSKLVENLVKVVKAYSKNNYRQYMESTSVVDEMLVELASSYIGKNIYILSSKTRLPLKRYKDFVSKDRDTIILMEIQEEKTHYEPVGKLITNSVVGRNFKDTDIISLSLHNKIHADESNSDNYYNIDEDAFEVEKASFNQDIEDSPKERAEDESLPEGNVSDHSKYETDSEREAEDEEEHEEEDTSIEPAINNEYSEDSAKEIWTVDVDRGEEASNEEEDRESEHEFEKDENEENDDDDEDIEESNEFNSEKTDDKGDILESHRSYESTGEKDNEEYDDLYKKFEST